jgi:hypothetical protein
VSEAEYRANFRKIKHANSLWRWATKSGQCSHPLAKIIILQNKNNTQQKVYTTKVYTTKSEQNRGQQKVKTSLFLA